MIKFQQSQALTSHFESFWSIVHSNSNGTYTNFILISILSTYVQSIRKILFARHWTSVVRSNINYEIYI